MLDCSLMNGSIISSGCLKVDRKSQIEFHNLSYETEIYNGGTFYFKLQHANEFMWLAMEEIGCRIAIRRSLCPNVAAFSNLNSLKSLSAHCAADGSPSLDDLSRV